MFLFLVSFFLTITSSVLFTGLLKEKKTSRFLIYLVLILISQVIISFEILSLLKIITPMGILGINTAFFILASGLWLWKKSPFPEFKKDKAKQVIEAVKSDKILLILSVLFVFCCLISLFFVIFTPTNNMDSHAYRLARVAFWVQNGSLEHFLTTDLRQIAFPINFEILVLWPHVFLKKDYLSLFPAFCSYFACMGVVAVFLKDLNLNPKRILWTILILASVPINILEMSSTQSDLFIGFLLFSSLYLFFTGVKNKEKIPILFSAIAYAISLGVKSTSILFIPAFIAAFFLISMKEDKKYFYRPFLSFIFYLIPAFFILSSYNYILTYIDFGNVLGPPALINEHLTPDLSISVYSFLLYLFYLLDFSGICAVLDLNPYIMDFLEKTPVMQGVSIGVLEGLNCKIHEHHSSLGFLSYLVVFPLTLYALTKLYSRNNRVFYLSLCGIFFIYLLFILSVTMGFSVYCFRYFVTAIVLTSPIFAFSYSKGYKPYKILIALVVAFNFTAMSLFNNQKPFFKVISLMPKFNSFDEFRRDLRLRSGFNFNIYQTEFIFIDNFARKYIPDNSKIGLVFSIDDIMYPFFEEKPGWKLYPVRYAKLLEEKNFDDYDYLITASYLKSNTAYQNIQVISKDIKYNYHRDYRKRTIIFTEKPDQAKVLYTNRKSQLVFKNSGQPTKISGIIEDTKLFPYFEKIYEVFIKSPWKSRDRYYRIYKNKNP